MFLLQYNSLSYAFLSPLEQFEVYGFTWNDLFMLYFSQVLFFYHSGVPKFLLKFLILVELMSYLARLVSLPTRLFANLISGHILIKILLGFSTTLLTGKSAFKILFILPWSAFSMVLCLEFLVGFLQSYVFIFLSLFYLSQVLNSGLISY